MRFTIPKITISADYGDDSPFGDVNVISLGYGRHQAWIYACMFGVQLFPAAGVKLHLGNSLARSRLCISFPSLCSRCFLSLQAHFDRKIVDLVVKRRILIVGAGMMGTGTALWIALGWLGSTCVAVDVLCGVLTGFGSGALLLAWGISFARCDALDLFKLGCRARDRHGAVCVSSASCARGRARRDCLALAACRVFHSVAKNASPPWYERAGAARIQSAAY